MTDERRFDAARLPARARRDSRGFLEVSARLTRTGVLSYRRADGTVVRELRHPDDVFAAESLETMRRAPITIDHPRDAAGALVWVDPSNARDLEVGVLADEPRRDGAFVDGTLSLRRVDAIRRVDSRDLCEVSAGYTSKILAEAGTYEGQAYTQRQTVIRYDHVALLGAGKSRCGDTVIRADSADAIADGEPIEARADEKPTGTEPDEGGRAMREVKIDGVGIKLADPEAAVVEKLLGERDKEKTRADSASAALELAKTDLAKATDPKALRERITARVGLEQNAVKVLGGETKVDGLSDRELQEAVLKKARPEFKLEGRTDDAISAAFEYAIASIPERDEGLHLVREGLEPPKRGDARDKDPIREGLRAAEEQRQNAWRNPAAQKGA